MRDFSEILQVRFLPEPSVAGAREEAGACHLPTAPPSGAVPWGTAARNTCPQLPRGVRLVRYSPKKPPVAVAPIAIVTDVDRFIHSYLRDLQFRLEHPKAHACAPLYEILAKLAEVGVELEIDAGCQR